jgi:signal transduction histidine kinase/CheY-like chemotaxis protein
MSAALQSKPVSAIEQRVLILAPTKRDGEIARGLVSKIQVDTCVCSSIDDLLAELRAGAGVLVITEDAFGNRQNGALLTALKQQPAWSELPIIALVRDLQDGAVEKQVKSLGRVTLLERPVMLNTFTSAVQTAIWNRLRQYQIRDLLVKEREAREEAERISRLKDEFIATLSHELRTPLSAILGWSQLLGRGLLEDHEIQEAVTSIERNARAQTQLIEDLLDMSRIISGKMRLDVQTVDPRAVIESAVETVLPAAEAKSIRVETVIDPMTGTFSGDSNRLQQVIWNLLSNAIKFTPHGGSVKVLTHRDGANVEIAVCDTGQGISAEFLPHVFDRFRQADGSTTRRHGGLGLGLAIVKQLVELHGGRVEARSDGDGCGSMFVIMLPAAITTSRPAVAEPKRFTHHAQVVASDLGLQKLTGLKVVAVDDEPDALAIIERVLKMCEAEVRTCHNAHDALRTVEEFQPDLIISDIGMPEVDGYELMQRLRDSGNRVPAIALTAFARSQDRMKALVSGFVSHIAKPVEPAELIATVVAVTGRT